MTVPARSRFGNTATRWLFRLATGRRIRRHPDRAARLPGVHAGLAAGRSSGDRYEYELNLLLEACAAGIADRDRWTSRPSTWHENSSSHFRPLADSVRIYAPLLAFLLSSMAAFVIDPVALLVLGAA